MNPTENKLKIAILDLYNGVPNQGMRGIREILNQYGERNELNMAVDEFEVRQKAAVPDTSYDIYMATGGPGSPVDSAGSEWENKYFTLIKKLEDWNASAKKNKKYAFFICHSFQLMCRHYELGEVCKRKSTSFGVFPVNKWEAGFSEPVFSGLPEPFFAVDSRDWQVIQPDAKKMGTSGARLLAIEKERPHVALERAVMAIRFSKYFIGTQFHPEADATGMSMYLQQEEKKKQVIADHGAEKYNNMLAQLNDPDKIMLTQNMVIPAFLDSAVNSFQEAFY